MRQESTKTVGEAQCPSCKKIASAYDDIENMFGFRNSNGKTILNPGVGSAETFELDIAIDFMAIGSGQLLCGIRARKIL